MTDFPFCTGFASQGLTILLQDASMCRYDSHDLLSLMEVGHTNEEFGIRGKSDKCLRGGCLPGP